jgi:hypothetical protein
MGLFPTDDIKRMGDDLAKRFERKMDQMIDLLTQIRDKQAET